MTVARSRNFRHHAQKLCTNFSTQNQFFLDTALVPCDAHWLGIIYFGHLVAFHRSDSEQSSKNMLRARQHAYISGNLVWHNLPSEVMWRVILIVWTSQLNYSIQMCVWKVFSHSILMYFHDFCAFTKCSSSRPKLCANFWTRKRIFLDTVLVPCDAHWLGLIYFWHLIAFRPLDSE